MLLRSPQQQPVAVEGVARQATQAVRWQALLCKSALCAWAGGGRGGVGWCECQGL